MPRGCQRRCPRPTRRRNRRPTPLGRGRKTMRPPLISRTDRSGAFPPRAAEWEMSRKICRCEKGEIKKYFGGKKKRKCRGRLLSGVTHRHTLLNPTAAQGQQLHSFRHFIPSKKTCCYRNNEEPSLPWQSEEGTLLPPKHLNFSDKTRSRTSASPSRSVQKSPESGSKNGHGTWHRKK